MILKTTTTMGSLGVVWILFLYACGGAPGLDALRAQYDSFPEYNIILQDMMTDGNFIKEYYHRYKVVFHQDGKGGEPVFHEEITDWMPVSKKTYAAKEPFLGMTILRKSDQGTVSDTPEPPGYSYVGDRRYGSWRTDQSGNSFWEFYGKYALMRSLFGMAFGRPVGRPEWNDYRRHNAGGSPYFGYRKQYGTGGSVAQRTNPDFFARRKEQEAFRKTSFREKVRSRTRRSSMSGFRRRSGGFGK
jgi:hypothetical protein